SYFNNKLEIKYPEQLTLAYDKVQNLRYGENPHQTAGFYQQTTNSKGLLTNAEQLHGKELSYNNISDTNGGLETLKEFSAPTIVAVKHGTACGVGSAPTIAEAYQKAYEADPVAIFGGIVLANATIDKETAEQMSQIFLEVIIAPNYTDEALEILTKKKNIRILRLEEIAQPNSTQFVAKTVLGGLLLQDADKELFNENDLKVVTEKAPTEKEMEDLLFAWKLVKHTKSNGIVLAKNTQSIGIGSGQVSRIGALEIATRQAKDKAQGGVLASDAFFPFPDCVELAHSVGITAIIQPGGSIKDQDSIDTANKLGIAMVFTNQRHFKH
nr:bifunctional phosphoribosylaminoimidazolecarboxamide formyltransferase/IMP cyclohydrolase [Flavobacteriaceae bacterium]